MKTKYLGGGDSGDKGRSQMTLSGKKKLVINRKTQFVTIQNVSFFSKQVCR